MAPKIDEHEQTDTLEPIDVAEPSNIAKVIQLRRSQSARKPTISNEFVVYLQEHEFDIHDDDDPTTFNEAISYSHASDWRNVMHDEINSMFHNGVCDLTEFPVRCKAIRCKWIFKTKYNPDGKIDRYKAILVAKGYNQREWIEETFSPVSTKDAFRAVMTLVAHFNLELHQMDMNIALLNGELVEDVYMIHPEGFIEAGKEKSVCKLKKSIYGLKQAYRQWY